MISKAKIKYIRSLHLKKFREQNQEFIIENAKMIKEAIKHSPSSLKEVYGTELPVFELPKHTSFTLIDEKALSEISVLQHPQSYLSICSYLPLKEEKNDFYLALDTLQNPGNMGTLMRLAAWFGITTILASKDTVDCYNPKVVQASMGAVFTVNVIYCDLEDTFKEKSIPIYGALLEGKNVYEETLKNHGILLIGNEGNGISDALLPLVTHPITIPKFGKGESLNAAMATGILLSEFFRGV